MKLRRGKLREQTEVLLEALDEEVISLEARLENIKRERALLRRKLEEEDS